MRIPCSTDETFDAFENWVGAVLLGVDLDNEGIFGGQGDQHSTTRL